MRSIVLKTSDKHDSNLSEAYWNISAKIPLTPGQRPAHNFFTADRNSSIDKFGMVKPICGSQCVGWPSDRKKKSKNSLNCSGAGVSVESCFKPVGGEREGSNRFKSLNSVSIASVYAFRSERR